MAEQGDDADEPTRCDLDRRLFLRATGLSLGAIGGGGAVGSAAGAWDDEQTTDDRRSATASGPAFEITAQASTGSVAPGETTKIYPAISNGGDGAGDPSAYFQAATDEADHNADYYGTDFDAVDHEDDGGNWEFEGWSWSGVGAGETRKPSVTIEVAESVNPGEYTFAIEVFDGDGNSDDRATATVAVGGDVSLSLTMTGGTAEAGGTVTVEFELTNTGGAESTGLEGFIQPPSSEWALADAGSFTSLGPGETETVTAEVNVPDDAAGEYTFYGWVEDDAGNEASDTATVTVESDPELDLTVSGGTAEPGGTASVTYRLTNPGNVSVGGDSSYVSPVQNEYPPGTNVNEGSVDDSGAIDGKVWYDWTVDPSEEITAELELELPADIETGEHEFAAEADVDGVLDSDSGTVTVTEGAAGFDPTIHGFGFENWSGFDTLSYTQIVARTDDLIQSEITGLGIGIADNPGFKLGLSLLLEQGMEGWANGHCLGMVTTATDYYDGDIPDLAGYDPGVETAVDIELPDGTDSIEDASSLDPVETDIDNAQADQLFDTAYVLRYVAATTAADMDGVSVDDDAVLRAIDDQTSNGTYPELGLTDTLLSGHAVLAYDVEGEIDEDDNVQVAIYDPNRSGDSHQTPDDPSGPYPGITFFKDPVSGDYQFGGYDGWDENIYVSPDVETDYDFFVNEESVDGFATALERGLSDYLAVGVTGGSQGAASPSSGAGADEHGVEVSVTTADGAELVPADVPAGDLRAAFGYDLVYAQFGSTASEYEVEVSADEDATYTVEVKGSKSDGGVIDDSVTGTISGGETRTFGATLPDEEGEEGDISSGPDAWYEPYVNANGVVDSSGLNRAVQDYLTGSLDNGRLNTVVQSYLTGNPID